MVVQARQVTFVIKGHPMSAIIALQYFITPGAEVKITVEKGISV